MTDNPLVEAVARSIIHNIFPDRDFRINPHYEEEMAQIRPIVTAALRAIEDAGWKVVKKEDG